MTRQQLFFEENRNLGNFPDSQVFGKFTRFPGLEKTSQIPRHLGNSRNFQHSYLNLWMVYFQDFGNFSYDPRQIPKMPGNLGNSKFLSKSEVVYFLRIGNFSNVWLSRKFSKFPEIWGIPQISSHFRNFQVLKNIPFSTSNRNLRNFGNSSNAWESCEISQIPRNLGNSPNSWESGEFPKYLRESEGSLFFKYRTFLKCIFHDFGNFPNDWTFVEFPLSLNFPNS